MLKKFLIFAIIFSVNLMSPCNKYITAMAQTLYGQNNDNCGACKQGGGELFWFSPYSRRIHEHCAQDLNMAYQNSDTFIKNAFHDIGKQNEAWCKIIGAVQIQCGREKLSIIEYLKKHGPHSLKRLFDDSLKSLFGVSY